MALAILVASAPALGYAQYARPEATGPSPTGELPGLSRIGVDEHLDAQLPLDLEFRDEQGRAVHLRDYFDGQRPVLLNFAYYSCPMLCSFVLDGMANSIRDVDWTAGQQYEVVTISIDPHDTPERALAKRQEMMAKYGREGAQGGWHFLTGEPEAIEAATRAVGFRYFYNQHLEQYAHPAVVLAMTPQGHIARYLYGIQYGANDVRLSLLEASEGHTLSTTERIILYCYHYDPGSHQYSMVAVNVMKVGGLLTMLGLGAFFAVILWRSRKRRVNHGAGDPRVPVGI